MTTEVTILNKGPYPITVGAVGESQTVAALVRPGHTTTLHLWDGRDLVIREPKAADVPESEVEKLKRLIREGREAGLALKAYLDKPDASPTSPEFEAIFERAAKVDAELAEAAR